MEIKIKHIIIVIVIFIIGILSFIIIRIKPKTDSDNFNAINENETIIEYVQFDDFNELGLKVAEKNGDWSKYHLSKAFREKYNEKDGVFGNMQFDNVEYKPYNDGKYSFEDYSYLVITQGKKKTAHIFTMINSDDGYDIYFGDKIELTDENGQELDARVSIDDNNYKSCFYSLCYGGNDEKLVAVTDNFHRKYPLFLDIFEHYSPLRFNPIEFVPGKSSWDKQEAYFIVDSKLECKKRYYRVKFTLDAKGYLDDVKAIKVNEEEYDGDGQERINKITYQNSNWDNLKLTDNFRSKYDNKIGIMDDIENINIDIDVDETTLEINRKYITCFTSKNDEIVSYYFEYIKDKDGNLDNVVCEKLPHINKTAAEVKELYLKEHNIQQ